MYIVYSFKTQSAYTKTGRYHKPPFKVQTLTEAEAAVSDLYKKEKVYRAYFVCKEPKISNYYHQEEPCKNQPQT